MNVLLLEPDPRHAAAQQRSLARAGHTVTCANSVHQAVDCVRSCAPELLVMELMVDGQTALPVADYAAFACPEAEIVMIVQGGLFAHGELYQIAPNLAWVLRDPEDTAALVDLADHAALSPRHAPEPRRAVAAH